MRISLHLFRLYGKAFLAAIPSTRSVYALAAIPSTRSVYALAAIPSTRSVYALAAIRTNYEFSPLM